MPSPAAAARWKRVKSSGSRRLSPLTRAVGRGLANKETTNELYVSVKTIEFHLSRIYMKLDIRSRSELARLLEEPGQGSAQRR